MTVCICPDAGMNGHVMNCPMRKRAEPAKRIFDNPDHPQYGPVRRMWVILAQLDMLEDAERYSLWSVTTGGLPWDGTLADRVQKQHGEARSQRAMLLTILKNWSS